MNIKNLIFLLIIFVSACKSENNNTNRTAKEDKPKSLFIPEFLRDSAYAHIQKQLSFGHRVPGNEEHIACRDWLVSKFESYGVKTQLQKFYSNFFDRKNVPSYNIIGEINPDAKKKLLLAAHWDSRLVAEKDKNETLRDKPIMGADDGASGVAVLLELARVFKEYPLDIGIDFVLFDAEDQGEEGEGWCQGSKYWSKNPHRPGYSAKFGILLDMVGSKGATFKWEAYGYQFDRKLHEAVWKLAGDLGYSNFFIPELAGGIEDDHVYVMQNMGIPMIDIINTKGDGIGGFGHYHHTHEDDIDIISPRTLQVVGKLMNHIVYRENGQ